MKNFKKILILFVVALSIAFVLPDIASGVPISNVEAAAAKISKSKATLIKGQTLKLEIKNNSKKIKWSTTNKKIATVTSKGKVTAKKAGTVTIIAKIGKKQYKCKIKVETPKISNSSLTLIKGSSQTITMTGNTQKIKWSTSNKSIATVSSKGKVTAKNAGTATITATIGTKKYKCKVTVKSQSSQSDLKKLIKYESYKPSNSDYVVTKFTNTSSSPVYLENISIVYYNSDKMVYTDSDYDFLIHSNSEGLASFNKPRSPYTSFEISYSVADTNKYYIGASASDKIKINSNKSVDGVTVSAKNTLGKEITKSDIGIIFYKNNEVLDFDVKTIYSISSGSTQYIQFRSPYDDEYNNISFDKYELFVFDTYY